MPSRHKGKTRVKRKVLQNFGKGKGKAKPLPSPEHKKRFDQLLDDSIFGVKKK